MKKFSIIIAAFFFCVSVTIGQDLKKDLRPVNKAITAYKLDQSKTEKLFEAQTALDGIFESNASAKNTYAAQYARASLYNALSDVDVRAKILNPEAPEKFPEAPFQAFEAAKKAVELGEKDKEKKDAILIISEVDNIMANAFGTKYNEGKYKEALSVLNSVLSSHEILSANGVKSIIEDDEMEKEYTFYMGDTAVKAEMYEEATAALEKAYKAGYNKAALYTAMTTAYEKLGNKEKADAMLKEGLAAHPDDSGLLFTRINQLIGTGDVVELEELLTKAIEKEPNNPSIYAVMGNVYNNLYKTSTEAGDADADKHFEKALSYFDKATNIDPEFFNAIYSSGELYYNRAAATILELQKLESDYSKEGLAKYDAKKVEMTAFFDDALPYFQKCEALDANDRNTLIALREIYARKDDLATSDEFKARLDKIDSGAKNDKSYFNK